MIAACQAALFLPECAWVCVRWVGDAIQPLILCCPFYSICLQPFPASRSFPMSWLFASGGQSIGASTWALVLPVSIQDWFPFRIVWLDLLAVHGALKSFLAHHNSKHQLRHSAFFMVQLSYPYMITGNTIALTGWTFVSIVMSLLFNMLARFVIAFLLKSKCLLVSWLQSPSAMILEPKKRKSVTASAFSPNCHKMMGPDAVILVF